MKKRYTYTGRLCIYRESSMRERLSAEVKLPDQTEFYYYVAPKCFDDLITDGLQNVVDITFTADKEGRNPRNVKVLSNPR